MADTTSTLSSLMAKSSPPQTLLDHSREAVDHLVRFLDVFSRQVHNAAALVAISDDELVSRLFASVWLHDLGKANPEFQRVIEASIVADREGRPREKRSTGIHHPLLSTPFALAAAPMINGIPYEAVAVMSHHAPYHGSLYQDWSVDLRSVYLWDAAWAFYQLLPAEHHRALGRDYPFPLPEPTHWDSRFICSCLRDILSDPPGATREVFGLFAAAIHYGDWLSSGHRSGWRYVLPDLGMQVRRILQEYGTANSNTFASRVAPGIQAQAAVRGHLLLTAPTGAGKTEASLLWAAEQPQQRLVYLLPTRVTSNAMFERVRRYVGDLAGLAHGTAGLVIGERDGYTSEAFRSRLYHSTFMKPATIATVDQLLLTKFNWNEWGLVETNAAQAAIIFDEIHAYDLYTFGLILYAAHELAQRGTPLCFMSATMPDFVREAILQILKPFGPTEQVWCPEADNEERHRVFVRDEAIEAALPRIVEAYEQGKKALVVVNTVDMACNLYEQVRDRIGKDNAMLFHSRFIERDRRVLEDRIISENVRSGGFVAVVTQIVEVSLDIDYDVMFTQAAPVDSLVQRLGRVNRKGLREPAKVEVFQADTGSRKVYSDDETGVLTLAWQLLQTLKNGAPVRQGDVLEWVRVQYPEDRWLPLATKAKQEAEQQVRKVRAALWQIQTLRFEDEAQALWHLAQSRRERFPSLEVVPECFREAVKNCRHSVERQNYVVRIPAYLVKRKYADPDLHLLFASVDYHPEFGIRSKSWVSS